MDGKWTLNKNQNKFKKKNIMFGLSIYRKLNKDKSNKAIITFCNQFHNHQG